MCILCTHLASYTCKNLLRHFNGSSTQHVGAKWPFETEHSASPFAKVYQDRYREPDHHRIQSECSYRPRRYILSLCIVDGYVSYHHKNKQPRKTSPSRVDRRTPSLTPLFPYYFQRRRSNPGNGVQTALKRPFFALVGANLPPCRWWRHFGKKEQDKSQAVQVLWKIVSAIMISKEV